MILISGLFVRLLVPFLKAPFHVLGATPSGTIGPSWTVPPTGRSPPTTERSKDQEEEEQWEEEPEGEEAGPIASPTPTVVNDHRCPFTVLGRGSCYRPGIKPVLIGQVDPSTYQHYRQHDCQHSRRPIHHFSFLGQ